MVSANVTAEPSEREHGYNLVRRERCVCGGCIVARTLAVDAEITEAVRAHYASLIHARWSAHARERASHICPCHGAPEAA